MQASRQVYTSALSGRYASREMQYIFSDQFKFTTWRRLWLALARAQQKQGLKISGAQIAELAAHIEDIDYDLAEARERETRHDVMAHVQAYASQCPQAAPIIHLGATSCYVGDNTDIIVMREACRLLRNKLAAVIAALTAFADEYRSLPCLAYTHLQPAQPTTVGKRAAIWLYELTLDHEELLRREQSLLLLGSKGTTGTQASFMELFAGDSDKIRELERDIAEEMGFSGSVPLSGQTYSRKTDANMLAMLSGIAQSASKFAHDMRLLQSFEEMEEPFGSAQIGSSAMPYKRNPMLSERICALSRHVITNSLNPALTAAAQWMERSLDDSANKRLAIPEAFLAVDAILEIYRKISSGLVVNPLIIRRRLMEKLPFMATENILMRAAAQGGDRQELHERLRQYSQQAAARIKNEGADNDLPARIAADADFGLSRAEIDALLEPALYVGRAPEQVAEFLRDIALPLLAQYGHLELHGEVRV